MGEHEDEADQDEEDDDPEEDRRLRAAPAGRDGVGLLLHGLGAALEGRLAVGRGQGVSPAGERAVDAARVATDVPTRAAAPLAASARRSLREAAAGPKFSPDRHPPENEPT